MLSIIGGAERLRRVLQDWNMVALTDLHDLIQLCRRTVQMYDNDCLGMRIFFERPLKRLGGHIPGIRLRVDKHRRTIQTRLEP